MIELWHLAEAEHWAEAVRTGVYRRSTRGLGLDEVGFVHCSYPEQAAGVADAFFAGAGDLVLLRIDPARVGAEVRVEDGFPHVYGPVPVAAVTAAEPLTRDATGRLVLPDPGPRLRCAVVLRVEEQECEVWSEGRVDRVRFTPPFPSPRRERVAPGHLVAVAAAPDGAGVVVWRWYDAVVLGPDGDGVRLWEPAHGEVVARPRPSYVPVDPGSRAWASAGLPGADWWVAGTDPAAAELDAVAALYADRWPDALEPPS